VAGRGGRITALSSLQRNSNVRGVAFPSPSRCRLPNIAKKEQSFSQLREEKAIVRLKT
jgi:hypothetical protein